MKHTLKHIFLGVLTVIILLGTPSSAFAASSASSEPVYTTLRNIDYGTFNEYRYKITQQFFNLREYFEINGELHKGTLQQIAVLADTGYKYLPNNLKNQNYKRELLIDIQKGIKSPSNEIVYNEIIKSLAQYLEDVQIQAIKGSVEATPKSGNAPLTVTLRGKVSDPTGTQILSGNYTWWIDVGGEKVVVGRGPAINYTFREEGKFSIFLDVTSSHKNEEGYTDVLPFSSRADIVVNEKIASLIVKVDGERIGDNSELKFTPDDANYGLLFDATSSTPTSGARFTSTSWDFGNGIKRTNSGNPRIERVRYGREGDYDVTLKLRTNEGKTVEKKFIISVHDPIAKIEANREDGYIGDKFTFSAKSSGSYRDLTYNWEIIDIEKDKVIHQKSDKLFTYTFTDKGRYNVRLKVRQSSGEIDQDTRIIYVTSQAPIAEFESKKPFPHKPNRVFLDASRSFDPDFSDDGNLDYDWFIDGNRVTLEDANANGSIGYYVFDSIGSHSVNLEVTDPDGITSIKKGDVVVDSILSVEMYAFPRVIKRNGFIKFVAESPEADVYEWDFGDGKTTGGNFDKVTHKFEKSGAFDVTLKVSDGDNNTNTFKRTVYVSDSNSPYALMDISYGSLERPVYEAGACQGAGAYVLDRVQTVKFDGSESINIDGETTGLEYSWKIGQSKFSSSASISHRFDETGCFPVKLTVKSKNNGSTHTSQTMVSVRNVKPTLSSLSVQVENPEEDPLVVRVNALGTTDPDGVIQSYLWYYYTETNPDEPQDFRSTSTSSTAFVIPKVTGNYYFVAILKDNNEARITSEEITGSRYFTTITGDNINTPIVKLAVDDNSTVIGEELTFTASAHNILGQAIEKDASFSWDFDGDGFYDTQTNEPTTTYTYRKSGEFYAKVKVKYRGISSTKNVTVNVSNKLVPDFDYISIGNTFIFFDSSDGQVDSRQWDLGDGTKKSGTYFTHTYTDKKSAHDVKLTISEGTKVKEFSKTVTKNVRNILKAKKPGLVVFTSPEADEDGKITFDNASQKLFVYMGESTDEAVAYAIDYDIEDDSDLNGGMDDDENNKGTASYISGDVTQIPLSAFKTQKIRLYIKDADGNILGSQDIEIEKTYIEETLIDPDMIVFEGVTESEKEKIESLKALLVKLPQQQKIKALSYVQKLQENWNDNTEKTRTILDFENYIFELALSNEDEIISLLESLLVEGQEDQSEKQITYQALVNLIPTEITCTVEQGTCYDNLLSKLEDIKLSDDTEFNKNRGKEILEVIGTTDLMTNSQKLDFKAILTSLVYGGDSANIPTEEKQEVIDATDSGDASGGSSGALGVIFTILTWIGYFILVFILLVAGLYILYLIFNKDKSVTFSEFINKITSFGKDDGEAVKTDEQDDIFDELEADILDNKEDSDIFSSTTKTSDPLTSGDKKTQQKAKDPATTSTTPDFGKDKQEKTDDVPDWLKGSFAPEDTKSTDVKKETKTEVKVEEKKDKKIEKKSDNKKEDTSLASKDNLESKTQKVEEIKTEVQKPKPEAKKTTKKVEKKPEQKSEPKEDDFDLEKDTKLVEDQNVPDWLKGSFETDKKSSSDTDVKKTEKPSEKTPEKKIDITPENKVPEVKKTPETKKTQTSTSDKNAGAKDTQTTKQSDVSVPDWLKGSFDEADKTETPAQDKKASPEKKEEKTPEKVSEKKVETKTTPEKTQEKTAKPAADKQTKTDANAKADPKKDTDKKTEKKDDLWDDGMKVPDWLKSDQ